MTQPASKVTLPTGAVATTSVSGLLKIWPSGSRVCYCPDLDLWYGLMGTVRPVLVTRVVTDWDLWDNDHRTPQELTNGAVH